MMDTATAATAAPETADHRRRLLDAMSIAVARNGYGDTTIADIAAQARVSKRTFYEHFSSKAECLLALYVAASEQALASLQHAIDPARDWHAQVERAVATYLGTLSCNPPLLRTLFIEILHLGPQGLQVRRQVNQRIAAFIVGVVADRTPGAAALLPHMAMAIVGGINELVLQAIERDEVQALPDLAPAAAHLVRVVIDGTLGPQAGRAPAAATLPRRSASPG